MVKLGWGLLGLFTLGLSLVTLVGFFGRAWWVFDLASNFRVQYFFLLLGCTIIFLLGRKPLPASFAGALALVNLALISPFYLAARPAHAGGQSYRLLHINLLKQNTDYGKVRERIQEARPDIIHLVEANQTWLDKLQPVRQDYPYEFHQFKEDGFGVALLSRFPIEKAEAHYFGDSSRPTVIADIHLEGHTLRMVGAHPPPPTDPEGAAERNKQIDGIARFVAQIDGSVLVVGDFNITSWSPHFKPLLQSGLRDTRLGFGVQPTWPTDNRLLMVPIDHILVSPGINLLKRQVLREVGSDHLPVSLDFSLN